MPFRIKSIALLFVHIYGMDKNQQYEQLRGHVVWYEEVSENEEFFICFSTGAAIRKF
jgi:hypothetical protein